MFEGKKNEEAVSPVIGVILMVAITVVLAATIAMYAFGSTDKIGTNKVVALQSSATDSEISINLNGGADLVSLKALKFKWNGQTFKGTVTANTKTVDLKDDGGSKGILWANATGVFEGEVFHVGDTITLENKGGKFQVIGVFADNTEQAIYEKTFTAKPDN